MFKGIVSRDFQVFFWCHSIVGMHRISGRIIRPFLISCIRPDTKLVSRISGKALYRISGYCIAGVINSLFFLQIRQEKICTQIDLVTGTRSCFVLCLLKTIIVSALKNTLFCILPKAYLSRQISGRISGIRP
jgi:hypothetical protein